jgi:phosphoglycerate dehydrogenase-like enzyme
MPFLDDRVRGSIAAMRIHIQTPPPDDQFVITPRQWEDAAARRPDVGQGHALSFADSDAGFAEGIADAELLVGTPGTLKGRSLSGAAKLKMVFVMAAGMDKLMPFDWLPPGVALLNNRGAHGPKMREFALMALAMLNNRMPAYATQQRREEWTGHFTTILRGKTCTVVGVGDLGGNAGAAARSQGMATIGVRTRPDPHPEFDRVVAISDIDSVLPESEFLVLACPLLPETRNLLSRERMMKLPKGAKIVNVGRGPLLDQEALCDLLDSGHLDGAVIDVTTPEPLPAGHRAWTTRNLVITPHVSADSPATYNPDSLDILLENLRARAAGRTLPNQVDLGRGY